MASTGTQGGLVGGAGPAPRHELRRDVRKLLVDGVPVHLGGRAFDLLVALADPAGRVTHKDELLQAVWPGRVVEENRLQVLISALRKLLGADAIRTVSGRGYLLDLLFERRAAQRPLRGAVGAARRSRRCAAGGRIVEPAAT